MLQADNDSIVARVGSRELQHKSIRCGFIRVIERVTSKQTCVGAELVIHPAGNIVLVSVLSASFKELPGVSLDRAVRFGPQRQIRLQRRIDHDLSRRGAGRRIRADDALPGVRRERLGNDRAAEELAKSFIVGEEEQLVPFYRSADGTSILISAEGRNLCQVKEISRVQCAVSKELERSSMICIAA